VTIKQIIATVVLSVSVSVSVSAYGYDFGQKGQVYSIIEKNFLEYIYEKLNRYKDEGRLEQLQDKLVSTTKRRVMRPSGVNLPPVMKTSVRYYDPSLTLEKDIYNEKGQLIAAKGTKVNPLDKIGLTKKLVFINADNDKEVTFARKQLDTNLSSKIILVNGSIYDVNIELNRPVYFDQEQRLINRFNITHTPTVIDQHDRLLRITEVRL
jgi:conjugal transfer pilus assembly protein TraW